MNFFDPGEPSHTFSQCWSFPRNLVSGAPEFDRHPGEPVPAPSATVADSRDAAPDPGSGEVRGEGTRKP